MKFIKKFEFFNLDIIYDELMGKLLRLYSSIPLTKRKADIVIKLILRKYKKSFTIGEDIILDDFIDFKDKVRFQDYFDSLLSSKETRGFNFEGTMSGFYNGILSDNKKSRNDVFFKNDKNDVFFKNDKNIIKASVKFINNNKKATELGSFKTIFKQYLNENKYNENINMIFYGHKYQNTEDNNINITLRDFFSNKEYNNDIKKEIWLYFTNNIKNSENDVNYWIIAYPYEDTIRIHIINNIYMFNLLCENPASPKDGNPSKYSLAIHHRILDIESNENIKINYIQLPKKLEIEELKNELDNYWAIDIFGEYIYKRMRPDVLRYIKKYKDTISKKLKDLTD